MTNTKRQRIERLLGTDETKGARGNLMRAQQAKSAGWDSWGDKTIDQAIAGYQDTIAAYQALLRNS